MTANLQPIVLGHTWLENDYTEVGFVICFGIFFTIIEKCVIIMV